jgi:prepilin-type N-terminal cleavage/methylation domain-containing protein
MALLMLGRHVAVANSNFGTTTQLFHQQAVGLVPPHVRIKENQMKTLRTDRKSGFTLVEIMIVVAIIGLLAAIAIPNFMRARQTSQTNACINNLRIIDAAKQQWGLETGQVVSATPASSNIIVYMGRSGTAMPVCPLGTSAYSINALSVIPQCAYYSTNTHRAILSN